MKEKPIEKQIVNLKELLEEQKAYQQIIYAKIESMMADLESEQWNMKLIEAKNERDKILNDSLLPKQR